MCCPVLPDIFISNTQCFRSNHNYSSYNVQLWVSLLEVIVQLHVSVFLLLLVQNLVQLEVPFRHLQQFIVHLQISAIKLQVKLFVSALQSTDPFGFFRPTSSSSPSGLCSTTSISDQTSSFYRQRYF